MRNKFILIIMPVVLILINCIMHGGSYNHCAEAEETNRITVNGTLLNTDTPPCMIDDRLLVPLRVIFEAIGAQVEWNESTQTAIGKMGENNIRIQIGNTTAKLNGMDKMLDVPATIVNGRTLVPVRFISESLGAKVTWNEKTSTAEIVTEDITPVNISSNISSQGFISSIFTDNMVLQRQSIIPIWGEAPTGEKITITFAGQTASTVARDNQWKAELQPLEAGGPYEMTVESSGSKVVMKNIMVGEVWFCSGQSNMLFKTEELSNAAEEIGKANVKNVRLFRNEETGAVEPQKNPRGKWMECSSETVKSFSAIGYLFARELSVDLDVPVGIIESAIGGSNIKAWMKNESPLPEEKKAVFKGAVVQPFIPEMNWVSGAYYNAMVAPVAPYSIRGVLWYQGEANATNTTYADRLKTLVEQWRSDWNNNFTFLYVQLPKYGAGKSWNNLREQQFYALGKIENTGMVVTIDTGDKENIHPKEKQAIAHRLALAAKKVAYGMNAEYSGPLFKESSIKENKISVKFDHVGTGLVLKDNIPNGFEVCGPDKAFQAAKVKVVNSGEIEVWADGISKPEAVRYAFSAYPNISLYNSEGLPASPFRTDKYAIVEQ